MIEIIYTWADVHNYFEENINQWPDFIHKIQCYWDGIHISYKLTQKKSTIEWLKQELGYKFYSDENLNTFKISLESIEKDKRFLNVYFEESLGIFPEKIKKSFYPKNILARESKFYLRNEKLPVDIFAWHSFKGGVGRTTSALQFAQSLSKKLQNQQNILLIDMDFEAPGITWMIHESNTINPIISMNDILTLIHGSDLQNLDQIIDLIAQKIKLSISNNIFIIPAFRKGQNKLNIKPENLEEFSSNYSLVDLLSKIGQKLNSKAIILDLRAGKSDLAASILFDPRINRILVTTLAGQSIKGTKDMLDSLKDFFPKNPEDPSITILISKINDQNIELFNTCKDNIIEFIDSISLIDNPKQQEYSKNIDELNVRFTFLPYSENINLLPLEWDRAINTLNLWNLNEFKNLKVDITLNEWILEICDNSLTINSQKDDESLDRKRDLLNRFTEPLITGEIGESSNFLYTNFIKNIIKNHQEKLPIIVAEGAKGSGKTFTFLRIIENKTWRTFAQTVSENVNIDATFLPLIWSKNLGQAAKNTLLSINPNFLKEEDFMSNSITEAKKILTVIT